MRQRPAVVPRGRGLVAERGSVMAPGLGRFRRALPPVLDGAAAAGGSSGLRRVVAREYTRGQARDREMQELAQEVAAGGQAEEAGQRLPAVPGVGPRGATALVGAMGDGRAFRAGREVAAWLGRVPRQDPTGGKPR